MDHEVLDKPGRAAEVGLDLCKLVGVGEEYASVRKREELAI